MKLSRRRNMHLALRYVAATLLTLFFLFPIYWLFMISFKTADEIYAYPPVWWPSSIQFSNYLVLFKDGDAATVGNSLIVAGISTVVSTLLGAMLGLALCRFRFPAKNAFDGWIHLPIIIPEICMGVAMMAFFSRLNISLGLFTITVSHIAFTIPFVAVVIRSRMAGYDYALEESSRDLGANQLQTFMYVTFPYMVPGIVAGALLALTLSLDDFVITFFTSGPGSTTLPIKIFSMVRFSVTPEVNAASTVLIVMTLILADTTMIIMSRKNRKNGGIAI